MDSKFVFGICIFAFLFLLMGCTNSNAGANATKSYVILPENIPLALEVADTPAKMEQGLMFRQTLGQNAGMIFIFAKKDYQNFWMYNMKIPLEILFLDENMKIVDIQEMMPCASQNPNECANYISKVQAMYAIELNKDFSKKNGVKMGDRVANG